MSTRKLLFVLAPFLISALVVGGALFYNHRKAQVQGAKISNPGQNPAVAAQAPSDDENKKIVAEVAKLIKLPMDETPIVRSITDIDKLKAASYGVVFKDAKNGDKVIIYTNNKKIIIYDSNAKQIINVAPFNIATGSAQPQP